MTRKNLTAYRITENGPHCTVEQIKAPQAEPLTLCGTTFGTIERHTII